MSRTQKMKREEINSCFMMLVKVTRQNLMNKPQSTLSVVESGIQLLNEHGKVLAEKGSNMRKLFPS